MLTRIVLLSLLFTLGVSAAYADSRSDEGSPVAVDLNPGQAQSVPMANPNNAVAAIKAQENQQNQQQALQKGGSFVTAAPDSHADQYWKDKGIDPVAASANGPVVAVIDSEALAAEKSGFKALNDSLDKANHSFTHVAFSEDKKAAETGPLESSGAPLAHPVTALAGTRWYATMAGGADSYVPGPVRIQLQEGPYAGAYALGQFQIAPDGVHLLLTFDTLTTDKTTFPINAVAVDPQSQVSGLSGDIDHHYLTRFIIPGTVGFFQGAINLLKTNQNVVVNGSTSTVSGPPLNNGQLALLMGSTAADRLQDATTPQGVLRLPEVKIAPGTGIGLLLLKSL